MRAGTKGDKNDHLKENLCPLDQDFSRKEGGSCEWKVTLAFGPGKKKKKEKRKKKKEKRKKRKKVFERLGKGEHVVAFW